MARIGSHYRKAKFCFEYIGGNKMKKFISIVMSILLLVSVFAPAAFAAESEPVYPTIIVAGYSSSNLYIGDKQIWMVDLNGVLQTVLSHIAQIGRALGELALQRPDYLSNLVGQEIVNLAGDLACNPDGSSINDITTYYQDAAHTQFTYLYEHEDGKHVHESVIMADVAALYSPDGNDHVFSYQQDFRMSMVDCAATLDKYIDSVLEFTGADKVNIFAVSHGGQTVAAYLAMYGLEKNVIHNVVMNVPAIGGAALAYDLMSETVVFDEETLLYFIENGQMIEEDINWLVRANQFGVLDDVCNNIMHRYAKQVLGYWGSIWDFIPAEYYDDLKNEMLDPVLSAALIEKSDYFHHEILANMTSTLNACVEEGMNIYIVAGCGMPSVTGLQQQSDAIIRVKDSTGSDCAPYGSRFSDGYLQKGSVCGNATHNHLSPDMAIDASTGFLPDYTWYVNGMYHGMSWKDQYSIDLCKTLILSDKRMDVFSDPAFPQFKYSSNRNYSVTAAPDHSAQGYLSAEDTAITITNLSHKYKMRLISVSVEGADVSFDVKGLVYLDPQESVSIPMRGDLPKESLTTVDITIDYTLLGSITPRGSRTLVFTLMNGAPASYDANSPYAPAFHVTAFEQNLSGQMQTALKKLGLFDWLKMLINSFLTILRTIRIG